MSTSKAALLLFFLAATIRNATPITTAQSKSTTATSELALFIKSSCSKTSDPSLCCSSLSQLSSTIKQSPLSLAQVATALSLSKLNSALATAASYYGQTQRQRPVNTKTLKALKDCKDLLKDAVDNTNYCMSQLKGLKKKGKGWGKAAEWSLYNVQTYMSAVLTKEDTCIDGLKEMGAVVTRVNGKVVTAEKYASNALGLVNGLRYG